MYQEILLWVQNGGRGGGTPYGVEDADPDSVQQKSSSVAKKDYNTKVLNHLELPEPANTEDRISFRDFVLLFASISTPLSTTPARNQTVQVIHVAKVSGGHVSLKDFASTNHIV